MPPPFETDTPIGTSISPYGVILVRRDIDRFGHNDLFAQELASAFSAADQPIQILDYRAQHRKVFSALTDPVCRFFLCFNGFGAELRCPTDIPGSLVPAFEHYSKPLFDLMHDCPAHEAMAHQLAATYRRRHLLITDYGYAEVAKSLGIPNVRFVPSITFLRTLAIRPRKLADRETQVLLPLGLTAPSLVRARWAESGGVKGRVYRDIMEAVAEAASADWRRDPLADLQDTCRQTGLVLDFRKPDDRFMLTTVVDLVKFERRRRLLHAISGLPVTVIGDRKVEDLPEGSRLRFLEPCTAKQLLAAMEDARSVLCPTPHMTGFHERVLSAFTAGSLVIASPNNVLETHFVQGRDVLFFRTEAEAVEVIAEQISDRERAQSIADRGRERAIQMFAPDRFTDTVLSLLDLEDAAPRGTPQ